MVFPVIPAKAGIQFFQLIRSSMDSGFHWSDDETIADSNERFSWVGHDFNAEE